MMRKPVVLPVAFAAGNGAITRQNSIVEKCLTQGETFLRYQILVNKIYGLRKISRTLK
jgi:hypothetical protein